MAQCLVKQPRLAKRVVRKHGVGQRPLDIKRASATPKPERQTYRRVRNNRHARPHAVIGLGATDVSKPFEFLGLGDIYGPKPHEFMVYRAAIISDTPGILSTETQLQKHTLFS